jgi:hypothetical protein
MMYWLDGVKWKATKRRRKEVRRRRGQVLGSGLVNSGYGDTSSHLYHSEGVECSSILLHSFNPNKLQSNRPDEGKS